jgi:DnaJ-class molecular chaperone
MSTDDYNRYFEALEVRPNASLSEIRDAYLHLKDLYSSDSMVTLPIAEEFSRESREEVLREIEEAFVRLKAMYRTRYRGLGHNGGSQLVRGEDLKDHLEGITSFNGPILRKIREQLNIELCEISTAIKVGKSHLENIERERFDTLPPEVYLRGFVAAYARYLSLDSSQVVNDYMKIYHTWKCGDKRPT